jgi:hypothetical protein
MTQLVTNKLLSVTICTADLRKKSWKFYEGGAAARAGTSATRATEKSGACVGCTDPSGIRDFSRNIKSLGWSHMQVFGQIGFSRSGQI